MTDRKTPPDPNETPQDIASLYSWANLHGAKYRDFSASRALTREQTRLRALQAAEEQAAQEQLEKAKLGEREPEQAQLEAEPVRTEPETWQAIPAAQPAMRPGVEASPVQPVMQPPIPVPNPAPIPVPQPVPSRPLESRPLESRPLQPRSPEAPAAQPRPIWAQPESVQAAATVAQPNPGSTSPDREDARWFALSGVFDGMNASVAATPVTPAAAAASAAALSPASAPVLAVFSLAGGVGKTSLVATLGRALTAHNERVLLVDTASYGLLPFFFGARDQRPGVLRSFGPPGAAADAPVRMLTLDPDSLGPETAEQETLTTEIARHGRGVSRIIVDLATASGSISRRMLRLSPIVLVPVIPDLNSVVSVGSIDMFFERGGGAALNAASSSLLSRPLPYYVLNRFDSSLPLHLDVRNMLREQLGNRLLPFTLRRAPAVSEALAEGMTVIDYAPGSTAAEDFASLAEWVRSLAAPAGGGLRGARWSER